MKFKKFILQNKKFVASIAIGLFLGTSFGLVGTVSNDEYEAHIKEKEVLASQIEQKEVVLASNKEELTLLDSKQEELKKQKEDILEQQRIAKEEAERIAKEEAEAQARAEAERLAREEAEAQARAEADRLAKEEADRVAASNSNSNVNSSTAIGEMVYKTATGSKYHRINNCGNTNPDKISYITVEQAKNSGLSACSKCY